MSAAPGTWPKLRVVFHDPAMPPEIITLDEAQRRGWIDAYDRRHLESGAIVGCGPKQGGRFINSFRELDVYTAEDCIRDAATELLAALKGLLAQPEHEHTPGQDGCTLCVDYNKAVDAAEAAIAHAEGR